MDNRHPLPKFSEVLKKVSGDSIPESLGTFLDIFITDYPAAAETFSLAYQKWLGIRSVHQIKEALVDVVDGLIDETLVDQDLDLASFRKAVDEAFRESED